MGGRVSSPLSLPPSVTLAGELREEVVRGGGRWRREVAVGEGGGGV
jgi:hypothetical protein